MDGLISSSRPKIAAEASGTTEDMKSFLDACRLDEPLQLVVEAAGEPDVGVRVLHQPFALIGRDPHADVPLEHRLVSRRHVYIQVVEGHAFWIDLESRLGTMEGDRARKHGWLTRDETIRIGPYEIRRTSRPGIHAAERPPAAYPLVSRAYGSAPWPKVGLEFINGPSRSAVWPMNRVMSLVGSASACKFRLADPSVSPFHCSLVRTQAGLWVVDLLGGGVEVNNAAVRYAMLSDGDILAVGRYRIRIQSRIVPEGRASKGDVAAEDRRDRVPSRLPSIAPSPSGTSTELATAGAGSVDQANLLPQAVRPIAILPAEIQGGLGESASVLVPLMNQFGMMQQQMLDQFQSAMGMLVQMFGNLQREQMDLIRQELDQLREVTREFQDLKAELAAFKRDVSAAPPTGTQTPLAPASPLGAAPKAQITAPFPPPRPSAAGDPKLGASSLPEAGSAPNGRTERIRPPSAQRPEGSEGDVMLWLNQRIASLQEERESRWQKILKLLPGSS